MREETRIGGEKVSLERLIADYFHNRAKLSLRDRSKCYMPLTPEVPQGSDDLKPPPPNFWHGEKHGEKL